MGTKRKGVALHVCANESSGVSASFDAHQVCRTVSTSVNSTHRIAQYNGQTSLVGTISEVRLVGCMGFLAFTDRMQMQCSIDLR
jgi:hypothetical protein